MGFNGLTTFPFGTNENIGTLLGTPGYSQMESGLLFQWGTAVGVNADYAVIGSAWPVVFPVTFPFGLVNIQLTVFCPGSPTTSALEAVVYLPTLAGFDILVFGGTSAQTTSVAWFAIGY